MSLRAASRAAPDRASLPDTVIREASAWYVRLGAEEANADDDLAWRRWLASHPLHRVAWERVERLGHQFGHVEPQAAYTALTSPRSPGRRRLLTAVPLVLGAGGLAATQLPWDAWRADLHTPVGQQGQHTLADGSRITLNTDSAIDVRVSPHERRIVLRRGEVHIASRPDTQVPPRPLRVATPLGTVTALGTRFVVRLHDDRVWVAVTEGAVRIALQGASAAGPVVEAGHGTSFSGGHVQPVRAAPHPDGWMQGALFADNMRLDDFLAELSRYRAGRLGCDPAVAGLRLSGSYPLDDTDRILAALEGTLPVRTTRITRYWVMVRAST